MFEKGTDMAEKVKQKRKKKSNIALALSIISLFAPLAVAAVTGVLSFIISLFFDQVTGTVFRVVLSIVAALSPFIMLALSLYTLRYIKKNYSKKRRKTKVKTARVIATIAEVLSLISLGALLTWLIVSAVANYGQMIIEQFPTVVGALNLGFLQTLKLFGITLLGAIPLGLLIAFGSMSQIKPVSSAVRVFVWIIRGSPLMLQLLIIYYFPGLVFRNPIWGGGETGRYIASAVAFIINYACYFSEIYRGGIQGVPHGQQEAGMVLGLSKGQIFFKITLLQMVKRILPPMSNEIITLVKDTSLARIIALQEVIWAGQAFLKGSQGISGVIWPLFFTGVYYLAFSGLLTLLFGWIEKKLSYFKA